MCDGAVALHTVFIGDKGIDFAMSRGSFRNQFFLRIIPVIVRNDNGICRKVFLIKDPFRRPQLQLRFRNRYDQLLINMNGLVLIRKLIQPQKIIRRQPKTLRNPGHGVSALYGIELICLLLLCDLCDCRIHIGELIHRHIIRIEVDRYQKRCIHEPDLISVFGRMCDRIL